MSMTGKRAEIAALILQTLETIEGAQYESSWRIDEHYRLAVLEGASAEDRRRVMGDPVRYGVVYHVGTDFVETPGRMSAQERPLDTRDAFAVELWYRYQDHEDLASSSEAMWNAMTTGTSGVLDVLRATAWLSGSAAALGIPQLAAFDLVALTSGTDQLAHHLTFAISAEGVG
jgi:hypothetical protein